MTTVIELGALLCVFVLIQSFALWRGRTAVRRWATACRYELLHLQWEPPWTSRDAFWSWSRGQPTFYVVVEDKEGGERHADVVCGNWIGGVLVSDEVQVHWL